MNDHERGTQPFDVPPATPTAITAEVAARLAALPEWTHAETFVLVAEIAARLRMPCAYLDDQSFVSMVLGIAETTLRLQAIDSRVLPR